MLPMGVKFLGAIFVFAACSAAGWKKGENLLRRVRVLEDMIVVLSHLRDALRFEIGSSCQMLQNAAQNLLLRELRLPFENLRDDPDLEFSLEQHMETLRRQYCDIVYEHEFQYFSSALTGLLRLPASQEENLLEYSSSQLSLLVRSARSECEQQRKLYRAMGLSFGGMAALLLL